MLGEAVAQEENNLEKDKPSTRIKSTIEADMDRVIAELLHSASIKKATKILRMPDSETTHEYQVRIDTSTNQPEVIETVTSTKQECAICGKPFAQVFACIRCKAKVCREHYKMQYKIGVCTNCAQDYERKHSSYQDQRP